MCGRYCDSAWCSWIHKIAPPSSTGECQLREAEIGQVLLQSILHYVITALYACHILLPVSYRIPSPFLFPNVILMVLTFYADFQNPNMDYVSSSALSILGDTSYGFLYHYYYGVSLLFLCVTMYHCFRDFLKFEISDTNRLWQAGVLLLCRLFEDLKNSREAVPLKPSFWFTSKNFKLVRV